MRVIVEKGVTTTLSKPAKNSMLDVLHMRNLYDIQTEISSAQLIIQSSEEKHGLQMINLQLLAHRKGGYNHVSGWH